MRIICSIIFITISSYVIAQHKSFYVNADAFFKKYVSNGKVDYKAIRSHSEELNDLVHQISVTDITQMDQNEKKAFYINGYNILTIKNVMDYFPIKSPLKIDGFFDKIRFDVGGEKLTLNEIENKKLRTTGDPRIHFALVCAAKGCPALRDGAFFPDEVDQQLHSQTKKSINSPQFTRIDRKGNKVLLSEIFKWYREDFGSDKSDIIEFLNQYLDKPLSETIEIDYYDYNWELNGIN